MPAWTPDTTYTRFVEEHLITPTEKAAIMNWVSAGALKGDTTQAELAPHYTRYKLNGTADLERVIPTFTSNAGANDSYVCFSLPSGLLQDRILRAYEIVAGNPAVVHHVIAGIDTTGTQGNNLGGSCYNLPGQFMIGGYAPGAAPTVFPSQAPLRMGIRIKAGSNIMLQIHYPAGTSGMIDSTRIRLYFYPTNNVANVRTVTVSTPLQNWLLSLPAYAVKTCYAQYPASGGLTSQLSVFATFPHSHKLATRMLNCAYKGIDTVKLIRINDWDFNQQGYYYYRKLIKLDTGYTMYSAHVYDNTAANPNNPNTPPQAVYAGFSTKDEMLFDSYQWLAYQPGDDTINVQRILTNDSLLASVNALSPITHSTFYTYAYPNPFESAVNIGYVLDSYSATVSVEIYSMYGTLVRSFQSNYQSSGKQEVIWDGKNAAGIAQPPGTYVYVVKSNSRQCYGKLNLSPSRN